MATDITHYKQMLEQPWGRIQYEITFAQLSHLKNKVILDFGAGFCITSKFLSERNSVTAIEPNPDLLQPHINDGFHKILGSYDRLQSLPDQTFDVIICHNVLEYIPLSEHQKYLCEFERLLKPNGKLSLIKHNQVGKVLQSVVFANDTETALKQLTSNDFSTASFTQGHTYTIDELLEKTTLTLENYLAIRTFYSLQPNDFKHEEDWLPKLLEIELAVADLTPYKDISFLQHLWLCKPEL